MRFQFRPVVIALVVADAAAVLMLIALVISLAPCEFSCGADCLLPRLSQALCQKADERCQEVHNIRFYNGLRN